MPRYDLIVDNKQDIFVKAKLGDLLMNKRVSNSLEAAADKCSSRASSAREHRPCSVNLKC